MNNMHLQQQLEMSRNTHDLKGIDSLRQAAQSGDQSALKEAAQQFEAIFVQMMLKSMRKAQDALADENSPFNTQQVKFYRDMHDQQLAVDLASGGKMGLADLIIQQFSPGENGFMPASSLRNDGTLEGINKQRVDRRLQAEDAVLPSTDKPQKLSAFSSPEAFIASLTEIAEEAASRLGIEPRALVAQAAVETGWGQFMIHDKHGKNSHNLFGIKADNRWGGDKTAIDSIEFKDGVAQTEKSAFRSYDSFSDSMHDYVDFVSGQARYRGAVESAADAGKYFDALQKAGYATDPEYAEKIMRVYHSPSLSHLSTGGQGDGQ